MGSPAWRGLWRGLSRCGRSPYTTPPPPSLYLPKVAEVPDASGRRHLAAQRHAISVMLAPSTNAEEWWKRRRRYHGASWVQAHAPSRFFSATPKEKADPSDLAVGDDAHGPGDKAMHNRFASAQPLALVEQGEADVRDDIPTDYSLIKPEDDDLTEVSKCYMLKTGADQIVPNKLSSFLKWAAEYGAREDVEIVYPLSSTISIVANWSGDGIISYVKMKIKQLEVNSSGKYYLSKNNEFLHDWVQEHVGDTVFEQKLVNPADETTKCCSENRMTSLIPQIIKIGFATIHLIHSFTADPDEVKRWQIRYLTKAAQAAGAFDSDFERGLICVELPPLLGLFGDACIRINEPDITYGKTMIKEVYAYLYLPLICRREMFPTLPSSYHVLPQMRRFFSRRKRKLLDEIILKAKNSGVLCLDGNRAQVESSPRKVIAQLRQFCYDHGERVDVSSIYGPGSEVYTPPGVGTFHLEVLHCNKSINFPISANKLYFRAFRCDRGMFVLKDEEDFICDAGFTVLDFTGSYTSAGLGGHSVGDTWVGVEALRHAFHVISKCNGRPSDLLKQAIKIFVIHIAEAARIQAVLNAVCESMSGARAYLDVEYPYALLEEWNTRKI